MPRRGKPSGIMETGSVSPFRQEKQGFSFPDKRDFTWVVQKDQNVLMPRLEMVSHPDCTMRPESAAYTSAGRDFYSFNGGQKTWDASGPNDAIAPLPGETNMRRFDHRRAPSDLAKTKSFGLVDKTSPEGDRVFEARPEGDKSPPKINVGMQDLQNPDAVKPHFVVKKDGSVEMRGDPEKLNSKDINIVLEREPGDLNPSAKQRELPMSWSVTCQTASETNIRKLHKTASP